MKKKKLQEMKMLSATAAMMKLAKEDIMTERVQEYYGRCYKQEAYQYGLYLRCVIQHDILKVALFMTKFMKSGGKLPAYELYFDCKKRDFITYDRLRGKWTNAKLDRIDLPWYAYHLQEQWISEKDHKKISQYLKTEKRGCRALLDFQEQVRKEQLEQRHKKEFAPWDRDMAQIKPLPKDWEHWMEKQAIDEHYIFYDYTRKGAETGYCTYCEREVPIQNPRYNKEGTCPCCKHRVVFKSEKKSGRVRTKEYGMYLIQRCANGIVIRGFEGYRTHKWDNHREASVYSMEKVRVFCSDKGKLLRAYYLGWYKSHLRWIPVGFYHYSYYNYGTWRYNPYVPSGKVYPKTLPSLAKKELRCTGLVEYIKRMDKVDPADYLDTWTIVPQLEQLEKAGLYTLVQQCLRNAEDIIEVIRCESGSLTRMLGIDGPRLKRLREFNGDAAYLKWLQYEKKAGVTIPEDIINWFRQENIEPDRLKFVYDRMSVVQIFNYIRRQMKENQKSSSSILTFWADYLAMAERLGMDTKDAIIYRVRKLYQRHDELVILMKERGLTLKAGEVLKKYPNIEKIYESIREKYSYTGKEYSVVVPDRLEDILSEGNNLQLCFNRIETYWDRINREESYIFFLRKNKAPDKAYYTLEVEPDGTVRQKRTDFSRQNKDIGKIMIFLKEWQKVVWERITDRDRGLAERSRILRLEEFQELKEKETKIRSGELEGSYLLDVLMADLMENDEADEMILKVA